MESAVKAFQDSGKVTLHAIIWPDCYVSLAECSKENVRETLGPHMIPQ